MTTEINEAWTTLETYLQTEWPIAIAAASIFDDDAVPELRFADVEKNTIPKSAFARFSMQPVTERQATFRNGDGGSQRYTTNGVLFLQLFVPRNDARAAEQRRKLANVGKKLFRGKSFDGCIWTRNVRINWLDPEPNFLRANVVADYEFDEIG